MKSLLTTGILIAAATGSMAQGPPPPGGYAPTVSPQQGGFVTVAPHTIFVIRQSAMFLTQLTLEDGALISVAPGITDVQMTCQKVILHGKSTFDLTPQIELSIPNNPLITKPSKPPGRPQPSPRTSSSNGYYGVDGAQGIKGTDGADGLPGVNLTMNILSLDASDGSLWIQNDGGHGGPGGTGGDGGKGSSGPHDGITNSDGGNGGPGGDGGNSGDGGPVGKVILTVSGAAISPTKSGYDAPSKRPPDADLPGAIVIYGSIGFPGPAGCGGNGGAGGEGHKGSGFSTDSKSGNPGRPGYCGHPKHLLPVSAPVAQTGNAGSDCQGNACGAIHRGYGNNGFPYTSYTNTGNKGLTLGIKVVVGFPSGCSNSTSYHLDPRKSTNIGGAICNPFTANY